MVFPPNPKYQNAGGEKMEKYGLFNIVDDLANGDPLKWDDVMRLENETTLIAMMMKADRAYIEYNMSKQQG